MSSVEGLQFIIMSLIQIKNRIKIIKIYITGGSVKTTYRKISDICGRYNYPSEAVIKNLVNNFSLLDWYITYQQQHVFI